MKTAIKTELFASRAPLEWAVVGNGTLYTAQIPIDAQGQVVEGGIERRPARHWTTCAIPWKPPVARWMP